MAAIRNDRRSMTMATTAISARNPSNIPFAPAIPDDNSDSATVFTIAGAATTCSQNPWADRRVTRCGSLLSNNIATANTANPSASVIQANPPSPENTNTSVMFCGVPDRVAAASNDTTNNPSAINASAKGEVGYTKIREALKSNVEVAAVLYHSPPFLIGISDEVLMPIILDGIEVHLPNAYRLTEQGTALRALAAKYPQIMKSVKASFYNPAIAAKASLRVEV